MTTVELVRARPPSRVGLGWAFFERQTNLWKRYWAWELVWLVYGVVNTLAITFIASEAGRTGTVPKGEIPRLTMFLLIGTLVWAYLSAILDDMSLTIMWERWEGTIEHTLMAPVPRTVHLIGMSAFGVMHALVRTILIMAVRVAVLRRPAGRGRLGHRSCRYCRRERQPGGPRDIGRHLAALIPGAGRADVVHGPGPRVAGLGRLLQRRRAAGVAAGCLCVLAGHLFAERDP